MNPDSNGALMTTPQAIQTVFTWFNANGGTSRPFSSVDIPGVSSRINGSLDSPNVNEWAAGIARQLGGRGSLRADFVYRDYADFYATRTDMTHRPRYRSRCGHVRPHAAREHRRR